MCMSKLIILIFDSYGWRFNTRALLENFDKILSFPETHNISFGGPTLFLGGSKSDFIQ